MADLGDVQAPEDEDEEDEAKSAGGSPAPAAPTGAAPAQQSSPQGSSFGSKFMSSFAGGGGGGGGGGGNGGAEGIAKDAIKAALVASDEREKKDVQPGAPQARSFLDALHAHEYAYKNPQAPGQAPGRFVSPMAQELEKAGPVGKSMVTETPHGKMVDYQRGLATMLAAQADLHHRMRRLEAGPRPHALAPHLKKQA